MSLHTLLIECLQEDTSRREKGKSVRLARAAGETVLMFHTDTIEFRKGFGLSEKARVSDVLFFYMRDRARPVWLFVELKGTDLKHACDQLRTTITAVRQRLRAILGQDLPRDVECKAFVVFSGSLPKEQGDLKERFIQEMRIPLMVGRDELDLRRHLRD
jgi:hypothetical protein